MFSSTVQACTSVEAEQKCPVEASQVERQAGKECPRSSPGVARAVEPKRATRLLGGGGRGWDVGAESLEALSDGASACEARLKACKLEQRIQDVPFVESRAVAFGQPCSGILASFARGQRKERRGTAAGELLPIILRPRIFKAPPRKER